MNSRIASISSARWARVIAALSAGIFLISSTPAQPVANTISGRYLLIFDTSSAMKKRVSATRYAVERLFFSMMNGQLHPGDTIGVWTFNRKLRAGVFPLQHWVPQNAALIASNITRFVKRQRYSRSTRFDVVMPDINHLVRSSERLTVLIFSDGEGEMKGTPFDKEINIIFKKNERALKKSNQAFILVLRSQFGHYTGFTVNSTAVGVDFPEFPPLPAPPRPAPPPKTNPPPAQVASNPPPVIQMPPLVIIGTNVSTNLIPTTPSATELSNPPSTQAVLNPPPETESHRPPAAGSLTNSTNVVPPLVAKTQTNAPATSEENPSGLSRNGALTIGAVLLVAAVGLIIFALVRSRKSSDDSLITRSLKKK